MGDWNKWCSGDKYGEEEAVTDMIIRVLDKMSIEIGLLQERISQLEDNDD